MNMEREREKLVLFTKIGVIVLSCLALLISSFFYIPQTINTLSRGISEKELPIYCVEQKEPNISLSFDAAWGNEDTATILSILKKHNVKVTFFMTGGWVEKYPDDVKAILADGHDLGNHSENHKQMSQLSAEQCKQELMSVHEKVKALTGVDMKLFRPPFGDYNDNLINTSKEIGYYVIQWNVDSLDWKDYGADSIVDKVTNHKNLSNGSIILCHNGAKHTKDALDKMITTLKEKGYQFVPISQLIYTKNYTMDLDGRQKTNQTEGVPKL